MKGVQFIYFRWGMKYRIFALFLTLILLTSCSRNLELTPHYKIVGLKIDPPAVTISMDSEFKFSAYLLDQNGGTKEADDVLWWVASEYAGEVEPDGTYMPSRLGSNSIYASSGGFQAEAHVEVVPGAAVSIEVYPRDLTLATGEKIQLYGYVIDAYGNRVADISYDPSCWRFDELVLTLDHTSWNGVFANASADGNGWVEVTWDGVVKRITIPVIDVPRYYYDSQWRVENEAGWGFEPVGVEMGNDGNIWVGVHDYPNREYECLHEYTPSGTHLLTLGKGGILQGEFRRPNDLVFDNEGNMYAADTENYRVQKFDADGNFLKSWGIYGGNDGEFKYPARIAFYDGYIYVTDYQRHCVQKFDLEGNFILSWGIFGGDDGKFCYPSGIAVDSNGYVYVADQGNNRIQKFDGNGSFIKKWGSNGYSVGQFIQIVGLTVDSDGDIYVVDAGANLISKFDNEGNFITRWGGSGSGDGFFDRPFDVAVDNEGNVYVADYDNNRIQKFRP